MQAARRFVRRINPKRCHCRWLSINQKRKINTEQPPPPEVPDVNKLDEEKKPGADAPMDKELIKHISILTGSQLILNLGFSQMVNLLPRNLNEPLAQIDLCILFCTPRFQ